MLFVVPFHHYSHLPELGSAIAFDTETNSEDHFQRLEYYIIILAIRGSCQVFLDN